MTAAIAINTNSPHYRQVPPGTEVLEVPVSNTLDNPVAEALEATEYGNFLRMTFPNAWNLAEDEVTPEVTIQDNEHNNHFNFTL